MAGRKITWCAALALGVLFLCGDLWAAPKKTPKQNGKKQSEKKAEAKNKDAGAEGNEAPKRRPKGNGDSLPAAGRERVDDALIQEAIRKGVEHLWSEQRPDGSWDTHGKENKGHFYKVGPSAMAAYALLAKGESIKDPRMVKALTFLCNTPSEMTYSLGLRANAFLLASRQNSKYRSYLQKDMMQLVRSQNEGHYRYESRGDGSKKGGYDNSNSQYGLLGVWAAAQADVEVPRQYWKAVMDHWLADQRSSGGWCYNKSPKADERATMTAAGIASLYVCMDNLEAEAFIRCGVAEPEPIRRGLSWMEKNFSASLNGGAGVKGHNHYYYLYGVERVALATGRKYIGDIDWYQQGARDLLEKQNADGGWGGGGGKGISDTGFALLFLIRGQQPVLVNKLEYQGDWNNRPRDLASLCRWFSRSFETDVNWQVVNLNTPSDEWHDAPALVITGAKAPSFDEKDIEKLRLYVEQGGTLISIAECGGAAFGKGIREVYKRMFPERELQPVPPDHGLYNMNFKLRVQPRMLMISNGIRPLVIHTDADLTLDWQTRRTRSGQRSFAAVGNTILYITDKQFRNRGVLSWPPEPRRAASQKLEIFHVQHNGNANPEPLALERFGRLLQQQTGLGLTVTGPAPAARLAGSSAKFALLCGTAEFTLTPEDTAALKKFIAGGGMLLLEAAGGSAESGKGFARSAEALVKELSGQTAQPLASTAALYRMPGFELERASYRSITRLKLGAQMQQANLWAVIDSAGRPQIILSREDITSGLLGYGGAGIDGYRPGTGLDGGTPYELMRNMLLTAYPDARPTARANGGR